MAAASKGCFDVRVTLRRALCVLSALGATFAGLAARFKRKPKAPAAAPHVEPGAG